MKNKWYLKPWVIAVVFILGCIWVVDPATIVLGAVALVGSIVLLVLFLRGRKEKKEVDARFVNAEKMKYILFLATSIKDNAETIAALATDGLCSSDIAEEAVGLATLAAKDARSTSDSVSNMKPDEAEKIIDDSSKRLEEMNARSLELLQKSSEIS